MEHRPEMAAQHLAIGGIYRRASRTLLLELESNMPTTWGWRIMQSHIPPPIVYTADIGALISVVGYAVGILQGPIALIAASVAAIFYCIQIYDRLNRKDDDV